MPVVPLSCGTDKTFNMPFYLHTHTHSVWTHHKEPDLFFLKSSEAEEWFAFKSRSLLLSRPFSLMLFFSLKDVTSAFNRLLWRHDRKVDCNLQHVSFQYTCLLFRFWQASFLRPKNNHSEHAPECKHTRPQTSMLP